MENTIFGLNIYGLLINLFFLAIIGSVTILKSFNIENGADYFLAEKKGKWLTLGISLFITILSSEFFFYILLLKMSIGFSLFTVFAASILAVAFNIAVLVPRFLASPVITITQLIEERIGGKSVGWITKFLIFLVTFIKLALIIYISGLLFQDILKIDMISCLLFIIFFTGVYTLVGGLETVASLQLIQTAGAVITLVYFALFGRDIFEINNFLLSFRNAFQKSSAVFYNAEISQLSVFIFLFLLAIWYWGFDQKIYQRVISASGFRPAVRTYVLSFVFFIFTVLILTGQFFSDSIYLNYNVLMSPQERHIMPFENGILMMGIFSWLMSSLSAAFHGFASQVTFDIYKRFNPETSQQKLILIARLTLTVLILTAILLVPMIKLASLGFFINAFGFLLVLILPLLAVFICAFLFNRISDRGVIAGYLLGAVIVGLKILFSKYEYLKEYLSGLYFVLTNLNFSNLALLLFLITCSCIIILTLWENKGEKAFFTEITSRFKSSLKERDNEPDLKARKIYKQIL